MFLFDMSFVDYSPLIVQAKDSGIQRMVLLFPGRNVVLFHLGA